MANRVYEVMYIMTPETADEDVAKLNESFASVITKGGGEIVKTDIMGRRRLAYPINKKSEGIYVLLEIAGSGQEIAELERRMRVNDAVIRYITVRVDEDRKAADKMRAKRERKASTRGAASVAPAAEDNQ
ncbi:MAG: 30S ribosomal protein S6 [Acidobacteriota bacterium]